MLGLVKRMSSVAVPALLASVLLGGFGMPTAEASSTRPFVDAINEARQEAGVQSLRLSHRLRRSSAEQGEWMLDRGYFGHRPSIRMTRRFRLRGEVLARSSEDHPSPASIVRDWLSSRSHRAVLLDARFRFVGVGITSGWLGDQHTTLVTGHFGALGQAAR
jgi:uncharacterized protein YkwD